MKPKWEDAPEWAQYLILNIDGKWYWAETELYYDREVGYVFSDTVEPVEPEPPYLEERPR